MYTKQEKESESGIPWGSMQILERSLEKLFRLELNAMYWLFIFFESITLSLTSVVCTTCTTNSGHARLIDYMFW